jgi:hypothetical protein
MRPLTVWEKISQAGGEMEGGVRAGLGCLLAGGREVSAHRCRRRHCTKPRKRNSSKIKNGLLRLQQSRLKIECALINYSQFPTMFAFIGRRHHHHIIWSMCFYQPPPFVIIANSFLLCI